MNWKQLFMEAEKAVEETQAELPEDIRAEAGRVPVILEKWPRHEGEEGLLGLYVNFDQPGAGSDSGHIVLFLGNLYEECADEGLDFREEVRITYLHELGHHLGWDEDDLERRGLA